MYYVIMYHYFHIMAIFQGNLWFTCCTNGSLPPNCYGRQSLDKGTGIVIFLTLTLNVT